MLVALTLSQKIGTFDPEIAFTLKSYLKEIIPKIGEENSKFKDVHCIEEFRITTLYTYNLYNIMYQLYFN